jgi:hypothetical protein
MKRITNEEIRDLVEDPLAYAMLMNEEELEEVVASFISVLNTRQRRRRGG